jgi:hypothetical protein
VRLILVLAIVATAALTACENIHTMSATSVKDSNKVSSSTLYSGLLLASCSLQNSSANIVNPDRPSLFLGKLI